MSFLSGIARWLQDPSLRGLDPDDGQILEVQRSILERKAFLSKVFGEVYGRCLREEERFATAPGLRIELGSGIGYIQSIDPHVIRSDVRQGPWIDRYLDAQGMDLEDGSVRMLLAVHVFHHIPDPALFFDEALRVLATGGVIILVEPWHGPVASLLYRRLFKDEDFDKGQAAWKAPAPSGPMRGANQALSYIVFRRDLETFRAGWPRLRVVRQDVLANYLRYLASGGLNFRSLLPPLFFPLLKGVEFLLYPLRRHLGLHQLIVIRKE